VALATAGAWGNGTEILGPPSIAIASGTGFAVGGVGLIETPQPAAITVDVPAGATVKQVLLYWLSEHYPQSGPDTTAIVNGINVTGESIGGPINFFSVVYFETLRADITAIAGVGPGANTISIAGIDSSFRTAGAGVLVIYDDGSEAHIELLDGQDLAYWRLAAPLDTTVPVSFYFEPANVERTATLPMLVGSVGNVRPNLTTITAGDLVQEYENLFSSFDGAEWDSILVQATVPAGADHITVHIASQALVSEGNPASLSWTAAGISIPKPEPEEDCGACAGELTSLTIEVRESCPKVQIWSRYWQQGPLVNGDFMAGDQITIAPLPGQDGFGGALYFVSNGRIVAQIATDCSAEIGVGLDIASFTVTDGESSEGGALCPIEPVVEPCGPCKGGVTEVTFQYWGELEDAFVVVISPNSGIPLYWGCVKPQGYFTVQGRGNPSLVGKHLDIYVNGQYRGRLRTTCKDAIGPHAVVAEFLVVSGRSRLGGPLCPLPDDHLPR
jgi:hypothetical protein